MLVVVEEEGGLGEDIFWEDVRTELNGSSIDRIG